MVSNKNSRVLAFFKPYGVLCAFTDAEANRLTLKNFIPVEGVYPAGRLDLDSEGLLLLSSDGDLIHRLTAPDHKVPKTYLVQVEGVITDEAIAALERGVTFKGLTTRRSQVMAVPEPSLPAREKPVTPHAPTSWLRMVLHEGKKRQIRHMTAAVGFPTLRLVRISIGNISLEGMNAGEWRELTEIELSRLQEMMAASSRRKQ